jgi:hypothetical protein
LEVSLSLADTYSSVPQTKRLLGFLVIAITALALVSPAEAKAQADFSWPTPVIVKKKVKFTAELDSRASHYTWDLNEDDTFGDVNGLTAERTFNNVRTYWVSLQLLDDQLNVVDQIKKPVVVSAATVNTPPDASFVFFPAAPVAGLPVTFVSTSTDPDSPIPGNAQAWDLNGDGLFDEATGPSATVTFPAAGLYPIGLRVTTNAQDIASLLLPVAAPGAGPGVRAFSLMSPFPVVRIAGRVSRRGARIRRLSIAAPPGTSLRVRCSGRGCPFKRLNHTVSMRASAGALPPTRLTRVRRLEGRVLRTGAVLRVFVTRSDVIGKYTRFRIRKGKPPARHDLCLIPSATKPVGCPAG